MSASKPSSKSEALYQRAKKIMPGGCSRNTILRKPYPFYADFAQGCYVTDIEGNKRIDFANNMASLIHGHSHPKIISKVTEQLHKGTAFTLATEIEILYAEHLLSRNQSFEKIRFVNSGTEAVMSCLKAARAFTGRPKIAKVEGAYHGQYDFAEVSQTSKAGNWGNENKPSSVPVAFGTPASALQEVIVIPFNDAEKAINILDQHKHDLACVLVDLLPHRVGLIPATDEFIQALRQWTTDNAALLIFDEVITLRTEYGGAQDNYSVSPDLTAMGKMIGGGFPVGAIIGRHEVMDVMDPLADNILFPHSGTFSANPMTMTAGLAAMELFDRSAVDRLNKLSTYALEVISQSIQIADIPACVTGAGSLLRVHLKAQAPRNYRELTRNERETRQLKTLLDYLFDHGIMMINTCTFALSTAMTSKEVDVLADEMLNGLRKIRN